MELKASILVFFGSEGRLGTWWLCMCWWATSLNISELLREMAMGSGERL
jgi:hypothetical protein